MYFSQMLILGSSGRSSVNYPMGQRQLSTIFRLRTACKRQEITLRTAIGSSFSSNGVKTAAKPDMGKPLLVLVSAPIGIKPEQADHGVPQSETLKPVGTLNYADDFVVDKSRINQPHVEPAPNAFAIAKTPEQDVPLTEIAEAIVAVESSFVLVIVDGIWQAKTGSIYRPAFISRAIGGSVLTHGFAALTLDDDARHRRMVIASCQGDHGDVDQDSRSEVSNEDCSLLSRLFVEGMFDGKAIGFGSRKSVYRNNGPQDSKKSRSELVVSQGDTLNAKDLSSYFVATLRERVGERVAICCATNPLLARIPFWERNWLTA